MSNNDLPTTAPQFDTGPLSWVMVEIREALGRSRTALFEAGGRAPEDQATQLQHAKSHLHQAHGALQMVDLDGVGLMTQAAEEALDRFKACTLKCTADHVQVVAQLYQVLVEYLEELLGGAPSQPVRLFPYYRAVQEMVGAERIHPADLFYPDLSQIPGLPLAATPAAADYAGYRQRFEKALLPYLKSVDAAARQANAGALLDAVTLVADAQTESKARTFWVALQSFAELVAGGHIEGGLYVKQLFGLINLQIRRLSQGPATPADGMLPWLRRRICKLIKPKSCLTYRPPSMWPPATSSAKLCSATQKVRALDSVCASATSATASSSAPALACRAAASTLFKYGSSAFSKRWR